MSLWQSLGRVTKVVGKALFGALLDEISTHAAEEPHKPKREPLKQISPDEWKHKQ